MRKKFLLMTFLTLLFTAMGTSVLRAQGNVAKVGDTEYAKLADAVNAAQADDEIKVIANIATNLDLTISKKVTLDLGGFTLSDAYIKIAAEVTVKNGDIKNTTEPYPLVVNSGKLTVEDVDIKASKSDRAIWVREGGELVFNSGSILATKGTDNTYSKIYGVWVSEGATANIYGGTITVDAGADATAVAIFGNYVNTVNIYGGKISTSGKTYSYAVWVDGNVTITGGEIVTNEKQYGYSSGITYGKNYAINSKGNVEISGDTRITTYGPSGYIVNAGGSNQKVNIEGGEFTNVLSEADTISGGHSKPNLIYGSSVDATIKGGDFNGYNCQKLINENTGSTLTITGGSFDRVPKADYVAVGATITVGETTYTKTEDGLEEVIPVASVNGTSYATLADALSAASAMTGDVTVEIYEKVTLNQSLSGSYSSIKFVGKDTDAEIYLEVQGYITATGKNVAFEDLKLSKSEGGFINNAGFMNVAFGVYDVTEVTYTNCTFANGACASSGKVTYTDCTFMKSWDKYGLWAYGNVDVTVDNCIFDDYRGIKMYAEGAAKTVDLTVKNTNFSAVDNKPAIVLTYGEKVTLENNTYSSTGVFELDLDGAPNGTPINYTDDNDEKLTCKNDNGACGVLCDGKIYTTVAQAAEVATSGSTVTLLHNSTETVELPMGVILDKNGYVAAGVTVAEPIAKIGENVYTTLEAAFEAATEGQTITLLADATPDLTSQRAITKAAVIDLGGKTLTLTEDDLYFGTTEFKNGYIIVDPSVKPSTAVFWMFANQTLTFDNVKLTATGVTGTYLIGLDGNNSDLNILNGSEIIVNNATALDLDIICVNASIGNDIVVDNSKVNVKNLDGRVFFRGNYTIKGNSDIDLDGITKAGFRIEAGQTLSIEDNATVDIIGEPRDGGIHLTDLTATYTVAETATVNATVNQPVAVAQIGTTKYGTLQAAIDAVQNGETIELLSDVTEELVNIEKASGVAFTIDGKNNEFTGEFEIGIGENINIKNIDFVASAEISPDYFIDCMDKNSNCVLTITGCTFTDTDYSTTAMGTHQPTNVVIDGCTAAGVASLLQNQGGYNITVKNTTVEGKRGISLGTVVGATVENVTINAADDKYGIRLNGEITNNTITIKDCNITAFIPVVVRKAQVENYKVIFNGTNTMTASNTDGLWCAIGTSEYETNGTKPTAPTGQVTVTLNDTGLSMDGVYGAFFPVKIGETGYATLAAAAEAAQAGDEIILLADVTEDVTLPAGITLNGNGKAVGNIIAAGTITFNGHTKATSFNVENTNTTVNIVEGACLEITGTGRMVIGHGCTFNITGTIEDAKTADKATLVPSLKIAAGASITGNGVTFNVNNAYIVANANTTSKNSNANGTLDFNINNSIWEQTGVLAFYVPTSGMDPTVNFELKNSVLTTTSHLVFAVTKGDVVFDNSNVNVGTSRQIENRSTMTVKNGSVVNGAVATSENAKNPGTLIVDNATYDVTGDFSGSDLGTGTLIVNRTANFSADKITKANIQIDATGMSAGDEVNITANLANLTGTIEVINNNMLGAKIVDGKIILFVKPVAKIGDVEYTTLEDAFKAATSGCTIDILSDVTVDYNWDARYTGGKFTVPVTINGNDKTIKFTASVNDNNYQAPFRFQAHATVNNLIIDMSEVADNRFRAISSNANLTVNGCKFIGKDKTLNCRAIIFGEGAGTNVGNLEISITNSEFINWKRGITDNENAQDVKTVTITGNTLEDAAVYVSAYDNVTFTGNTVTDAYVNIKSYTADNKLKVTATDNDLTANTETTYNFIDAGGVVEAQEGFVVAPKGDKPHAYVSETTIWGQTWTNAKESYVIKVLNAENEVMGTSALNTNLDVTMDGDVEVTWHITLPGITDEDQYWIQEWIAQPNVNNMPAKVELWVDDVKVNEGPVQFNGPDDINKIYAATADAEGKLIRFYNSIETIVNNEANVNVVLVRDVTGSFETFQNVTLYSGVEGGASITNTYSSDYTNFNKVIVKNGVTLNMNNVFSTTAESVNTIEGTMNVVGVYYHSSDAKTEIKNGGKVTTGGMTIVRYNNNPESGIYIYGDGDDTTVEFSCQGDAIGAYSGTFYAEDAVVETKDLRLDFKKDNSEESDVYAQINAKFVDTKLSVSSQLRLYKDAALTLNGATVTADMVQIRENATPTINIDNSTIKANSVQNLPGATWNAVMDEDGYVTFVRTGLAGGGTEENPYLINDISDLEFFRDQVNAGSNTYAGKYIKLTADIDLAPTRSGSNWTPIGNSTTAFQGTFDGDNHTISDLVINGGSSSNQGFFGMTTNGEIKNVIFENAKVSGRLNVGVVAGTPYTSKYTNIKVKGHVEVNGMAYVGGVGGKNAYANWTDITVDVDGESYVKATSTENGTQYRTYVGGVIGFNGEGGHTFKNITSNINVIGDVCDIGGIFGIAHYGNKFENITHTGTVTNTNSNAEDVVETGLIAGVWHNQAGTSVTFTNTNSTGTISVPNVTGVTFPNDGLIGAAYDTSHETSSTSGSLTINGEQVYPYVAKIGEVGYNTLAKAITAAQSNDVVTLLWQEGEAPIAMNASLYGKNVTITGNATVDWSEDWLFVGRGGAGDATLTFDNANLTSASNDENSGLGIHVSGRQKDTDNKYDGTLVIKNSTIELDYLIDRGTITLDEGANLTVTNGFGIAGRPASETENNNPATATISLINGAKLIVNNHNGMGVGQAASEPEGYGIMNIDATSTFETTQSFNISANGTMNVNGGNVKVVGTLTNNGAVNVTGESILDIETLTGEEINFLDGAIIKNSTVGGEVFVAGKVIFRGNNTFAMLYDFGTLTGYYGTTANMEWTVEEGASLTLTKMARYGLGYGDNVTIDGSITNALEARENLTEYDRSLFMHGLVAQESKGWNCNSKFTVEDAYVVIGSNDSFGNKPGEYGGNYTINFKNSVVDASRITFYEALSSTEFTFEDSDVKIGTFMTRDTDSKFTLKNSKVLSTAISNGTDEGNYNAGELTLDKSSLTYSAEFANTGTLNIGENSTFTAQSVVNNGAINFTALSAKLDTDTEGLTIVDQVNNPDYKVVYKDGTYQFVQKFYVAQIDNGDKFETLQEAVEAVEDGGTITLIANETFTENNRYNNGGWWDGLGYSGDKSFTIDLANFTISQDGALNDYLMWFKNDGAKANTITLKNGTLDAGTTAYCALATSSSNTNKITINTENIEFIGNNSGGAVLKIRGGAELNVNAGTKITGTDSYVGIECYSATVNIYDGTEIYQNGTSSYNGCLVGVSGNGTVNVYGGYGKGVSGGFIAMTSGGTINVAGGEWIANTDGSYANGNKSVLVAQSANGASSIVNVTGGKFRGGYNCYGNAVGDAQINISGGNFNADPSAYVVANYKAVLKDGTYDVIQIAGTQTFNMEDAGWYWFSTYIKFDTEGEGLDALKYELDDDASLIKGQYAFTNYLTYNNTSFWTSGNNALTTLSPSQMYMINTTSDNVEVDLTGAFLDYEVVPVTINVVEGWNWIGYPVSEEVNINNAIPNAEQGDVIKSQFDGYAMYYENYPYNNTTLTGWYGELTTLKPGRGYMYQASEDRQFSYNKGNGNGAKSNTIDYNGKNYWFADATQYPNNMSIVAMLSIDGEIVKGNYEVAAFANGECRGSARPIYIEAIDTYVLYMTIYGDEVEELTFMYYDIDKDTEYELNNVMNYSNDAIVGTLSDPYIFSMNILGIGENSIDNINIYPNPTTTDREINLQATCDKVEVFNALGVKVAEYHNVDTLDALETAGIYVIRITNDNAVKHCRLVVK